MDTLEFRTKHKYSSSASGIEVEVGLNLGPDQPIRLLAKIDTGASFCIFQRDYAEHMGIEVESGVPLRIGTATGGFDAFGHTVILSCFDWTFETTVYFAEPREFNRNVLGRQGWLENFRMAIIDHDSLLYLSKYDD
ncbi:MAG: hypothetical protein ABI972_08810 [Acidobacteriota bacterium]